MKTSMMRLKTWANEDESIMDNIQEHSTIDWTRFNKVRLYLKVVTLSDLCTADFKFIDRNMYEANNEVTTVRPSGYAYNWPIVQEIHEGDIINWKRGLKLILGSDGRLRLQQTCMRDWDRKHARLFSWVLAEGMILQKEDKNRWRVWTAAESGNLYRTR